MKKTRSRKSRDTVPLRQRNAQRVCVTSWIFCSDLYHHQYSADGF